MIQRKKVGGITFLAIGRLRLSYCVAKAQPRPETPSSPARGVALGLGLMGALYAGAALYIVSAFSS